MNTRGGSIIREQDRRRAISAFDGAKGLRSGSAADSIIGVAADRKQHNMTSSSTHVQPTEGLQITVGLLYCLAGPFLRELALAHALITKRRLWSLGHPTHLEVNCGFYPFPQCGLAI